MQRYCGRSCVIITFLLLAFLTAAAGFWWLCTRSDSIAFLPGGPGAEWIVYPRPPESEIQHVVPARAVFRYTFALDARPARADLAVRAFKTAAVAVNGREVGAPGTGEKWKLGSRASVAGMLRAGTNELIVSVTNSLGPPALWLRLETDLLSLGTDASWQVSFAGTPWQCAHRAAQPPMIPSWSCLHGGERMSDSVKRAWPLLFVFCVLSLFLVLAANHWRQPRRPQPVARTAATSAKLIYGLLFVVTIARAALFINNLPQLPRSTGFDAKGHEEYIQFIQRKHALPLPNEGWEMQHPPLYYLGSAWLLGAAGASTNEDSAAVLLPAINGVVGLVHCWLALLCLRLLFPENLPAQAVGLLVAAFLPPHLYLSQYVTNEPLAGFFVTLAFYLCLRLLRSERESFRLLVGVGTALGAATLTKVSSLLAAPLFLVALGWRLFSRRSCSPRDWLRHMGIVLLSCFVVCGWHYGRVWVYFGRPIVGNWETDVAGAWWQHPGFRTGAYYLGWGQVFVSPLFSAFHSFADGIYSTLWGDGLVSAAECLAARPPWNYDLMNVGYLLSFAISLLFLVGLVIAVARFIRKPTPDWLMVLGLLSAFTFGILYMSLRVPSYAQIKAFYAFPALVSFSALTAAGWDRLGRKRRAVRTGLWVVVLVWTLTVYAAFWIRGGNPETQRVRGLYEVDRQRDAEAIESLSRTVQLNPDDATAHWVLASALGRQNRTVDAVRHYRESLRVKPDSPEALNNLACLLATAEEPGIRNVSESVWLAERACELTGYGTATCLSTLAMAYSAAGRIDDSILTAQKACTLALETGESDLRQRTREFLAITMNNRAWTLATSKEAAARDGARAVALAERACELTGHKQTVIVGTLAAAYAEAGRFDDAIATARRASTLAKESGKQDLLKKNQELLLRFEAHQSYRENTCGR